MAKGKYFVVNDTYSFLIQYLLPLHRIISSLPTHRVSFALAINTSRLINIRSTQANMYWQYMTDYLPLGLCCTKWKTATVQGYLMTQNISCGEYKMAEDNQEKNKWKYSISAEIPGPDALCMYRCILLQNLICKKTFHFHLSDESHCKTTLTLVIELLWHFRIAKHIFCTWCLSSIRQV